MDDTDDAEPFSSEMRFITLELMKIATKRKMPFKKVAAEFIANAYDLSAMIEESVSNPSGSAGKGAQ